MAALSPRESRLLAVLLLVAAAALVDLVVIMPLQDGFAARAQQRQQLLARYAANDRLIGAIPRLSRQAAQRDRQLADEVLSAADAGTAADLLRARLEAAATAVGGDFHGAEDIVATPGRPIDHIATRAALRLSAAQLTPFLIRLENARPFITISALAIRADDTLVTGQATTLDITLDAAIAFRPAPAR